MKMSQNDDWDGPLGLPLQTVPKTLLILGTNASGKDHVANLIANAITTQGVQVIKE